MSATIVGQLLLTVKLALYKGRSSKACSRVEKGLDGGCAEVAGSAQRPGLVDAKRS